MKFLWKLGAQFVPLSFMSGPGGLIKNGFAYLRCSYLIAVSFLISKQLTNERQYLRLIASARCYFYLFFLFGAGGCLTS